MLEYNINPLSNVEKSTLEYSTYKKIKSENPIYNEILEQLMYNLPSYKKYDEKIIDRVLSYYVLPQIYNDLSFGSLYRDLCFYDFSIHKINRLINIGVLRYVRVDNNSYYLFTKKYENIIKRRVNLYNILGS